MCTEHVELQSPRFLLVVIGPPGAGKTVFAHEFVKKVNYCQIVSKDEITNRYCGTPVDEADYFKRFRGPIYAQVNREIDYLLPSGPVVVDVTHRLERTHEGWENDYRKIAEMHKVPLFCIELYPPLEILWQRLEQRSVQPAFYELSTKEGRWRFTQDWLETSKLPADCGLRINNSGHPSQAVDMALAFMKERFESLSQARVVLNYT